jgi:hypothetical protein
MNIAYFKINCKSVFDILKIRNYIYDNFSCTVFNFKNSSEIKQIESYSTIQKLKFIVILVV